MYFETECTMALQGNPRLLILVPIASVYATNFLLVVNSNFGPVLSRFRDIASFLLSIATPPIFHPNFGGVSFGLDCRR